MVSFSKISRIHFLSVCVFFAVAVLSTSAKQESGIILVQSNATDASSTDCATAKCRRQLKHKRQAPGCDVVVMDDFNSATRFPTRRNLLGGWQDVGGGMAQARSTSGELQLTSTASGAYFFSNFAGTGCYNAGSRSVFRFVATPPSAGATFTLEFQIRNADCTVQIERREYWPVTLGTTGAQTVTINLLDRFTVTELTRLQAIAISGLSILNAPYSFDDFSLACPPTPTPTTSATATATSTSIATSATSLISTGTASPSCTPTPLLIDDFSSASRFASGRNALNFLAGDDGSIATKSIVAGGFSFTVSAGSYWYSDVVARGTCGDISAYSHLELQFSTLPNRNFYVRWRMYDVGGCTVSGSTNYVQVFLETYVPDSSGIIRIPLADFPGLIRTRVLNVGFRAFGTPGSTYVLRRIGLVNLACSPSTVTGSTTLPTATSSSVPTQTPTGTATSVSTTTTTASPTATPILCPGRLVDDFNDATRFSSNVNALNGYFGSGNLVMTRTTDGRLSLVPSSGAYWYSNFNRGACFDATASPYISFTVNAAAGASFSVEMQVRSADCATQIARRVYWSFTTTGTAQNIVLRLDDPDKLTTAELARLQAIVFVAFTPLSILYVFDDIRLNSLGPCSSTTATPSTTTTTSPPTPTGTPVQWPMPPYRIGESYTCGGGTICGNGLCCSSSGFCGETSEYCGSGCQSQCDKNNFPYFPVRDAYESFSSCAYLRDFSLTYDDGPHPTNTPQLLTALANAGVRTTFFVIGENVVSYPGTLLATFQAGHQIASHSFTHPDLTTLTLAQLNDEITRTENAIFNVIGRYPKYFRPPYGAINSQVASVLKSRGYRVILWNYDTKDFETSSGDVVYNGYTGYFGSLDAGRNSWITLQHDIQPSSIGAAVRVLNYLNNTKGYRLKPVWECLGDTSGYK